MTRILALAGLTLSLMSSLGAMADSRPVLRSEIATLSEVVTVGDFYDNAGPSASVPLFRAPDLGTSGTVPAADVAARARDAGLLQAGTDGLTSVVVQRRAEPYDAERLKNMAKKALAARDASLTPADLDISFYRTPVTIQANPAADEPISVDRVLWSRTDGRFTLFLSVATGNGIQQLSLTGQATELMEVAVLSQPLRRGSVLKPQDLTLVRQPRARVPANALTSPEEVAGLAARNNLRAGAPLLKTDFERPILIARGEKVTITYELPGLKLTTRGQALEDGAEGDVIDIQNLQSKRTIPGVVLSRGQVRVTSASPVLASLNEAVK
ncbi:flagellar basal body P-ring formation chaperone FlgA [Roseibium litorale]|uniref:Flagellar basal body P-ring formation protein FlgA n=1 Tax=Roseibium litorale TaxID=2803841 RepID=A0ABR9CHW6_9HYPH|nr:flagellar basal body P-ring formation chaperone FlgA [Roseibium litorale]MBD8890417.1 flagellar basal body P-ring formation protein FlgA [Roseibium litorale]